MSRELLLGIDEGTTAVKAALFDLRLRPLREARRAISTSHPRPGWVEQDPEQILDAVVDVVAELLGSLEDGDSVVAAGLDHQGESILAWDSRNGRPLTPVLVWQDKRQLELLEGIDPLAVERSGLPLDPYFSAGKLAWLIRHEPSIEEPRLSGALRMGTVDAFLCDRLGGRFATDLSTASRTQLLAVGGRDWDAQLLSTFSIGREPLPELGPTFGQLGELRHDRWPAPVALCAQLVDQQAALAGSGAIEPGRVKATYGTGVFVLAPVASEQPPPGLLPTIAWAGADEEGAVGLVSSALDGGVFTAGALLDWLARDMGLANSAAELAARAAEVADAAGVRVLPSLAGLGAPWWEPGAHAVIAGLHSGVGPAHVARAALDGIAWRVADIVEAIRSVTPVGSVRVDGGLTNDPTLMRVQADALGVPLAVGPPDTTVLGAAMLAGVGAGVFASIAAAAELLPAPRIVEPVVEEERRLHDHERWRAFVVSAYSIATS